MSYEIYPKDNPTGYVFLPAGDLSGTGSTNTTPRVSNLTGSGGIVTMDAGVGLHVPATSYIGFGASLPSTGSIRFSLNAVHMVIRRSDGTNMEILKSDGANNVTLGSFTNGIVGFTIASANTVAIVGAGGVTNMRIGGTTLGFFNTAAVVKQAIAGSRGGNVALANLLTGLAAYGLITDNTVV